MEKFIKSHGLTYLRYAVAHRNPVAKFITIPLEKAEEIIKVSNGFQPIAGTYDPRSSSVKGAAVVLGMDIKELLQRLESPLPSKTLNDLAEARNQIVGLHLAGDNLIHDKISKESIKEWMRAKSL